MSIIALSGTIVINKDQETVFSFLSDYRNDPKWRKEINQTTINTPQIQVGSLLTEDSFLSRKNPHYLSHLICSELLPHSRITCNTTPETKFYSKNTRSVKKIDNESCKVIYQLEFDTAIVKHGLGFQLPGFFLKFYTNSVMKDYLSVLKKHLENSTE